MKRKVIIGIVLILTVGALVTAGILKNIDSVGAGATGVDAAVITKGDLSSYVFADGVIEEVEKSEVYFDTPLRVTEVLAEEGQQVKRGQQLLKVDMDALNSQLDSLKINRNTQQITLDSKVLDAEVERAEINLKAAERNYNDAKKTYEDNKALYEANAISKAELDMSEKAFREADSGMSGLKSAKLAYETAVENRKNSRKSAEESIKAIDIQISDLEKKINDINEQCKAAIDGVVASISVQAGTYTNSMQPAFKIIDPNKLQVRAKVNEYAIKDVEAGQKVIITGDAIDSSTEVTGTVKRISPVAVTNMTANGNETVVEVIISVDSANSILKPGLNVSCDIATINRKDVLLAPMDAITPDKNDNMMVFVIDKDANIIKQRQVTVGISSDMNVEILDGLAEGEMVVIDPQPYYTDGMRVKVND
jgi:RND family efflux transporter MFP subunit